MTYKTKKPKKTEKNSYETKFGTLNEKGEEVITHKIDLSKINSSDPLAYAYGKVQGERGNPLPDREDLAKEFIRGWKEGHKKFKR